MKSFLNKTMLGISFTSMAAFLYSHRYHPIPINHSLIKTIFSNLDSKQAQQKLLQFMVKWELVNNGDPGSQCIDLKGKVMGTGFDTQGNMLRGLQILGFRGVEIGPISFKEAEDNSHLGILKTKANILTYFKNYPESQLQIGVNIIPDKQIIQFVPYLLPDNISKALKQLITLNQVKKKLSFVSLSLKQIESYQLQSTSQQDKKVCSQWISSLIDKTYQKGQQSKTQLFYLGLNNKHLEAFPIKNKKVGPYQLKMAKDNNDFMSWQLLLQQILQN